MQGILEDNVHCPACKLLCCFCKGSIRIRYQQTSQALNHRHGVEDFPRIGLRDAAGRGSEGSLKRENFNNENSDYQAFITQSWKMMMMMLLLLLLLMMMMMMMRMTTFEWRVRKSCNQFLAQNAQPANCIGLDSIRMLSKVCHSEMFITTHCGGLRIKCIGTKTS